LYSEINAEKSAVLLPRGVYRRSIFYDHRERLSALPTLRRRETERERERETAAAYDSCLRALSGERSGFIHEAHTTHVVSTISPKILTNSRDNPGRSHAAIRRTRPKMP